MRKVMQENCNEIRLLHQAVLADKKGKSFIYLITYALPGFFQK